MGSNQREKLRQRKSLIYFIGGVAIVVGLWLYVASRVEEAKYLGGHFVSSELSSGKLQFEIAVSPGQRLQGLMFRKPETFPADRGMIFVFDKESDHSFFMRNTLIPLDMVFLDKSLTVVGVLENIPIMNEESRKIGRPSLYVVELNAGTVKRIGITVGSKLQVDAPLPRAAL